MAITSFRGEYFFLSNFWPCELKGKDGKTSPSAEHAYQMCKCLRVEDREWIRIASSPGSAKRIGNSIPLRPDWNSIKLEVMLRILRLKFAPDSELAARLLATGEEELIEGNTWGDTFWGKVDGVGENHLGRLLMQVREELKHRQSCLP